MIKLEKFFNLDLLYFIFVILFLPYIFLTKNGLDIAYFCLLTFYYLKIKVHRWIKYH